MASHDWFDHLMGFRERDYASTQSRLVVDGDELVSSVNDRRYEIGDRPLPTLAELRSRVNLAGGQRSTFRGVVGDVRVLHAEPEVDGALFQVASQFNLLEMTSPGVTPEDGVARYAYDRTQGPAFPMAAGAATIYRNYCVPLDGGTGQTRDRQLDALAHLGAALSSELRRPVSDLWSMQNRYALCTDDGLAAITDLLTNAGDDLRDTLRGQLTVGCTVMSKPPTCTAIHGGTFPRRSARRCPLPTPPSRHRSGRHSRRWCWRAPTKPPCWRRSNRPARAGRTRCC